MNIEEILMKLLEGQNTTNSELTRLSEVTLKQEENLKEHMRRTDLLEKKLEPVERHVYMVNGGVKLIALLGAIVGLLAGIKGLY